MGPREALVEPEDTGPRSAADEARVQAFVTQHFALVWRWLLRLGVPRADAEDAR